MGPAKFNEMGLLTPALSYVTIIYLTPIEDEAKPLEEDIIMDRMVDLSDDWILATSSFHAPLRTSMRGPSLQMCRWCHSHSVSCRFVVYQSLQSVTRYNRDLSWASVPS